MLQSQGYKIDTEFQKRRIVIPVFVKPRNHSRRPLRSSAPDGLTRRIHDSLLTGDGFRSENLPGNASPASPDAGREHEFAVHVQPELFRCFPVGPKVRRHKVGDRFGVLVSLVKRTARIFEVSVIRKGRGLHPNVAQIC